MLRAVIFDMDGVIIDSEPLYFEIDRMVFRKYGFEVTDEFLLSYVGISDNDMWGDVLKTYALGVSAEELIKVKAGFRDIVFSQSKLSAIDGIKELLVDLKRNGVLTAVASSSAKTFITYVLKRLELYSFFDVITSGGEMKRGKPFPDIFLKTAELLNVEPKDCVVVEDSGHGLKAASAAGMISIGYANPGSGSQDLSRATCVVSDMKCVDFAFVRRLYEGYV